MLTMAYCRVSTDEQFEEGYSIEGQADKLRQYALLHELGEVTVLSDPGISGKNLQRPAVQQLLAAVEAGHVAHVLVWRLDRLSRSLADLILLADMFGQRGVALHSVSENLDLSSAAGRMFYNILATFAQYYREQLSENVKLGIERAVKLGKYVNRPKFGYDLVVGELRPNDDAVVVREVFLLRGAGVSYREIEERTGVSYSNIGTIVRNRVYVGDRPRLGGFIAGTHEPVVTEAEWQAANRTLKRGRHTSGDPLSGHVLCGVCGKKMSVQQNGQGGRHYKCRNRGRGCSLPARSNRGLGLAAALGLQLLAHDEALATAIRRRLAGDARAAARAHGGRPRSAAHALEELSRKRQQLLDLYYSGNITAEGFRDAEATLLAKLSSAGAQAREEARDERNQGQQLAHFEAFLAEAGALDFPSLWEEGTNQERRALVDDLIEHVTVFETHLEVKINELPALKVRFGEVGLKESESVCVGGGT